MKRKTKPEGVILAFAVFFWTMAIILFISDIEYDLVDMIAVYGSSFFICGSIFACAWLVLKSLRRQQKEVG